MEAKLEATLDKTPDDESALSMKGRLHVARGETEAARKILELLPEDAKFARAVLHAELGDWDEAFEDLAWAVENEKAIIAYIFRGTPMLNLFGAQPRYWELVERIGFPELPIGHPFREKEQELRYGKGRADPIRSLAIVPFENRTDDPFPEPESLGARLRPARMTAGLSQAALGDALGIRANTIGEFERGRIPNSDHRDRIAMLINRTAHSFEHPSGVALPSQESSNFDENTWTSAMNAHP